MKHYERLGAACRDDRESIAHITISKKQNALLQRLLTEAFADFDGDPQQQVLTIASTARSIICNALDREQHLCIERFVNPANHTAVCIENLPIGRIGETPKNGQRPDDKDLISEAIGLGMAGLLGYPIGYLNEKNGEIIQQVVPIDDLNVMNSNSSRSLFGFHVDNIFIKPNFRQELIGLFCLRNPSGAATLLLELPKLIEAMTDEMWNWAWKARCRFPASASFDMGGSLVYTAPRPILYHGVDGLPRVNANTYNMRGLSADDDKMIEKFVALTNAVDHHRISLRSGQLLLFHDDFAMHGREPFEGDRWLQRVYVRFDLHDLWAVVGNRSARVFDVRQFFFN